MAKDKGWVKVPREVLESGRWLSKKPFDERSAMIDLLGLANYADTQFCPNGMQSFTIPAGTVFRSVSWLSTRWGWSEKKVQRFLKALVSEGFVQIEGNPFGTLIRILDKGLGSDTHSDSVLTGVLTGVPSTDQSGVRAGVRTTVRHNKKVKKDKESEEKQDIKNTASRSRFNVWEGDPE